jgi:AcrR family transcriptional regulator
MVAEIRIFADEPTDTRAEIMVATYHALSKHGYTDLSIQRIGEEFDKSTSLLYHHYDTKDELLVELLEYVLDRIQEQLPLRDHPTAYDRLVFSLSYVTGDLLADDQATVISTLMELRSQALHDERFRARFTDYDQFLHEMFVDSIERGIENGTFREVDPDAVSEFLLSLIEGTTARQVTTRGIDLDAVRAEAIRYVDTRLLATSADQ